MNERFSCPDCFAEHTEPLDATLGHVARCLNCAIVVDAGNESDRYESLVFEIHIAA